MGERGPVGKRADQRLGHRAKADAEAVERAPGAVEVEIPAADPEWHPVALRWFESLAKSGQSAFYEPTDWATAHAVAESMSREFHPQPLVVGSGKDATVEMHNRPPTGAAWTAWLKAMSGLLVLEGDRRRLRLELQRRPEEANQDVSWIDDARARLRESS